MKLLVAESVSENTLAEQIAETAVGKAEGQKCRKYVGITFFAQLSGEPITAPHLRVAALNEDFARKLEKVALKGRSGLHPNAFDSVDAMQCGDMFIIADAGAQGHT